MTKIAKQTIFLGCDPEVFLRDKNTGAPVPAVGLVPGTKEEPWGVERGMVQVDGLAAEFGIKPARTKKEFIRNINSVIGELRGMLPDNIELNFAPTVEFSLESLKDLPPEALALGCDPDFSCYTLKANPRPKPPSPGFRSAGGHVHVGWGTDFDPFDKAHKETCAVLVAELDVKLGVPSLAWDSDSQRRQLYGKAGAFRPKPYGLEYRSLSNQWLTSEDLMSFVWDQTIDAFKSCIEQKSASMEVKTYYKGATKLLARDVIDQNWVTIGHQSYKEFMDSV